VFVGDNDHIIHPRFGESEDGSAHSGIAIECKVSARTPRHVIAEIILEVSTLEEHNTQLVYLVFLVLEVFVERILSIFLRAQVKVHR
jgi:hypothetical protein